MKGLVALVVLTAAAGAAFLYIKSADKPAPPAGFQPTTFYECASYFPVQESYPRRCTSGTGVIFVEDIGNAAELHGEISAYAPRPGDTVRSPLAVSGQARREWFEEQSISIEILSSSGNLLGKVAADSQKIIADDKLYPFAGSIYFEAPAFGSSGAVVIYKGTSHSEWLRIPVFFK